MSTPTASNSQSTPQLDESIRISHLEPKAGTEKKLGFLSFGHWTEVPGSRVDVYKRQVYSLHVEGPEERLRVRRIPINPEPGRGVAPSESAGGVRERGRT